MEKQFIHKGDVTVCIVKCKPLDFHMNGCYIGNYLTFDETMSIKKKYHFDNYGYMTSKGISHRHKEDKYDQKIGDKNAELKAMTKMYKKLYKINRYISDIVWPKVYRTLDYRAEDMEDVYLKFKRKYEETFKQTE